MMKYEFEELAGRTVTNEQYKMIEALYMESSMTKQEFVKSIKGMLKGIPEQHNYSVMTMGVHNAYGDILTPNGAYYMTVQVELINVNIKTGKKLVRVIPNSFAMRSSIDLTDWDHNLEIDKSLINECND